MNTTTAVKFLIASGMTVELLSLTGTAVSKIVYLCGIICICLGVLVSLINAFKGRKNIWK